jgi:hypothetical protein
MLQLCFQVVLFEEGKGHVVVNALICKVEQTRSEVAIFPKSASAKKAVRFCRTIILNFWMIRTE